MQDRHEYTGRADAERYGQKAFDKMSSNYQSIASALPDPQRALDLIADYTRKNPLTAVGIALAIGLFIRRRP